MTVRQPVLSDSAPAIRKALLGWFRRHRRPMPWRERPTAYRTVVSELMCQQTQIAMAIPYFEKWTQRWPDFSALAQAKEAEVLAMWAGLGYYSRARNLLNLARAVAALAEVPRTAAAWQQFKGVGPYTAAAIASIAFHEPIAVVDGNVVRVLARLAGVRAQLKDSAAAVKRFTPLADALVDARRPGDFNQAMMELGATVCRKGAPECGRCPLAQWCQARADGNAATLPRFVAKQRQTATVARALVRKGGKLLLRRNSAQAKRLAGMAELPALASLGRGAAGAPALTRRRTIGTVTYEERLFVLTPTPVELRRWRQQAGLEWIDLKALAGAALSGPHQRWVREWLNRADPKARD